MNKCVVKMLFYENGFTLHPETVVSYYDTKDEAFRCIFCEAQKMIRELNSLGNNCEFIAREQDNTAAILKEGRYNVMKPLYMWHFEDDDSMEE